MKIPVLFTVGAFLCFTQSTVKCHTFYSIDYFNQNWEAAERTTISNRIHKLDMPVKAYYDYEVGDFVHRYIASGHIETEKILGKAQFYFPIMEYYLDKHGLPESLKYLSVIESRLVNDVFSGVGAAGLWQFMPATGRSRGLTVNYHVDERLDVYKATEGAVIHLKLLYERFNNWTLALAAYNCGAARVAKTIEKSGTLNSFDVVDQLPKQTQKYIAKYIAMCYVGNYYDRYDVDPIVKPVLADDMQVFKVYDRTSLKTIASICNVSVSYLRKLNPAYLSDFIPASEQGFNLMLPSYLANRFKIYYQENGQTHRIRMVYMGDREYKHTPILG